MGKYWPWGEKPKPQEVKKPISVTVRCIFLCPQSSYGFSVGGPGREIYCRKSRFTLKKKFRKMKQVTFNYHDVEVSFLEAAFAQGDRRLGDVLEKAWSLGCKFDGWSEHFKYQAWMDAFHACGLEPEFFANRKFDLDEVLPWDHLSSGVTKKWLKKSIKEPRKVKEP